MKSPTRVKISFTVDLDEVPTRIASLLGEAGMCLEVESADLNECATSLAARGDPAQILISIDRARLALMGVDLKLEDCQSLLHSYQNTQAELNSGNTHPDPSEGNNE